MKVERVSRDRNGSDRRRLHRVVRQRIIRNSSVAPTRATPSLHPGKISNGYRWVLGLSFLGILLVTATAVVIQEQNEYETELAALENEFGDKSRSLIATWEEYEEAIDAVRLKAEVFLARNSEPTEAPLAKYVLREGAGVRFDLDHIPAPYDRGNIGNLTGLPKNIDDDFRREIEAAIYLNDRYGGLAYSFPDIRWLYYSSRRDFLNLFPWVSSSQYRFSQDPDNKGQLAATWKPRVPQEITRHSTYDEARRWYDLHPDDAGGGLIFTVSQPIFDVTTMIGVVGLDIGVESLQARLSEWSSGMGAFYVVGLDGNVVARSDAGVGPDQVAPTDQVFPADLLRAVNLTQTSDGAVVAGGSAVLSTRIATAPLYLVHVVPRSAIFQKIAAGDLWLVVAGLGGLLVMLFVATWFTDRRLIQPSVHLIDFIHKESLNLQQEIPHVPATWRPSFEIVRQAFESYREMISLHQELEVARTIQQSILPSRGLDRPEIEIGWRVQPAKEVGGDFYDFFVLDHDHIGIAIADVSGKGVPGALFMAITRTLLRSEARQTLSPGMSLERLNAQLAHDNESATFVTVFFGVLDLVTGRLTFANAGHLPPLLLVPGNPPEELPLTDGTPIGMIEGVRYPVKETVLSPGTSLFLYTDGLTEAFNEDGGQFGDARLLELFSVPRPKPGDQLDHVFGTLTDYVGNHPQSDDWTCLMLRYRGAADIDQRQETAEKHSRCHDAHLDSVLGPSAAADHQEVPDILAPTARLASR